MSLGQRISELHEQLPGSRHEAEWAVLKSPDVYATHPKGTRLVQALVESGSNEFHASLARGLDVFKCLTCMHGNFVLQSLVHYARLASIEPIVRALEDCTTAYFATHVTGCRIYCRIIEQCGRTAAGWGLVSRLMAQFETLVFSRFGHYVIQTLIEYGPEECVEDILELVACDAERCVRHKEAIFVVLHCLEHGARDARGHARLEERLVHGDLAELLLTSPARFHALKALARSRSGAVRDAAERVIRGQPVLEEECRTRRGRRGKHLVR